MRRFLQRLLNLLRIRRLEHDLDREIDAHLTLLQDDFEARGFTPEAARRAARLALGNVEGIKERHQDARSFRWVEEAWQDAAHGLRLLRRSPAFTATAVLSLAIGIGANTAIFSVADALLLRPPVGIANPSELVIIGTARGDGGVNPLNQQTYREIASRTTSLTNVFAEEMFPHVMGMVPLGSGVTEPVLGRYVTPNFFAALGAPPYSGRVFDAGDQATGVLDYSYWKRRFNGDQHIAGRVLGINGRLVTIVGVASPGFRGTGIQECDLWIAMGSADSVSRIVMAGGRLRPDVSFDAAVAELRTIGQSARRTQGISSDQNRPIDALRFSLAGSNRNVVLGFSAVLMVLVSMVLAVACANVAGITLSRSTARAREIALRGALGAGRGRLARQLLIETIVLFVLSGLVGIALACVLGPLAMRLLPPPAAPIVVPLRLDWRVVLFAMALSVGAAVVFGVLPALRGSDIQAGALLKDGVRSSSGHSRIRSAFLVGQVACSVLLVVLGASFIRIVRHAGGANPGFDSRGVDVAMLDLSMIGDQQTVPAGFWQALIDRVRRMPAVEAASLARVPPGGWEGIGLGGVAPADRSGTTEMSAAGWNIVDADYFGTLRIPFIEGRDFTTKDNSGAPPVVILSEALARRFWPRQSAIGRSLQLPPVNAADGRVAPRLATVVIF